MTAAEIIEGLEIYGYVGLGVAALFMFIGIDRVDAGARGSYVFRALLLPGLVALWPVVLIRWAQLELSGRGRAAASVEDRS